MAGNVQDLRPGEDGGQKLPSVEDLKKLMSTVSSHKADMDEARGYIGEAIKSAEETKNIHRKAFKQAMAISRMDPEHRTAYLAHLDHYRKVLDLDNQPGLFDEDAA